MKRYLFGFLLWLTLPLAAEPIRIDLTGQGYSGGRYSPFEFSFSVDSQGGSPTENFSFGCLETEDTANAVFTNVALMLGGQTSVFGDLPGEYSFHRFDATCPGALSSSFDSWKGPNQFFWSIDPPGITESTWRGSADPVGLLLHEFDNLNERSTISVLTPSGETELYADKVMTQVPEPQAWGLFLAGIAALFVWHRRRVSAS